MRFSWVATASGGDEGQLTEKPQAIQLLDQRVFSLPPQGLVEDLLEMSWGSRHLTVIERLALLASLLLEGRAGMDLADSLASLMMLGTNEELGN